MSRAIVIGITGAIRAGKGLTTSTLVRHLHADLVTRIINDNPGFVEDDPPFKAEGAAAKPLAPVDPRKLIGSKIRGGTGKLWSELRPEQRVTLCMDYWNKCEHLNLESVGIPCWHAGWAKDAFHVISQDAYLGPGGKNRMIEDIVEVQNKIDSDPSLPPWIIVEGYNILEENWSPRALLPLLDFLVVLHAKKSVIMSRNPKGSPAANEAAWNKECAPYLAQLEMMFPWLSGPEADMREEEDGKWYHSTAVNTTMGEVSGLGLQVAQFSGPGADGSRLLGSVSASIGDEEAKAAILQCFEDADTAGSGTLDKATFTAMMRRFNDQLDDTQLATMMKEVGKNEDREISTAEFVEWALLGSTSASVMEMRTDEIVKQIVQRVKIKPPVRSRVPSKRWHRFPGKNCYDGHGGTNVNLSEDNSYAKIMNADEARLLCENHGYAGFTYEPKAGRMWRLKEIGSDDEFRTDAQFDVHALVPEAFKSWRCFPGTNCYDGHGGVNVNLSEDNEHAKIMSLDEAKALCEGEGYAGFTYEPSSNRMWRLKEIGSEEGFRRSARFDVYVLTL